MMFSQDVQFALRTLRKNPGFACAAVLALALGIGANSAMFSVIDGILLRPLPFPQSDRLVNVWESNVERNFPKFPVAPANYYDWRAQNHVFSDLGAYQQNTFNLASNEGEPERYIGAICDRGFFSALDVTPLLGRVLSDEEDQSGRDGVVILSYGVWKQRFGGDPKIVGQTLTMDGRPRTVIGVMRQDFEYPPKATMRTGHAAIFTGCASSAGCGTASPWNAPAPNFRLSEHDSPGSIRISTRARALQYYRRSTMRSATSDRLSSSCWRRSHSYC
jgi:putative ABC transport system permease protein